MPTFLPSGNASPVFFYDIMYLPLIILLAAEQNFFSGTEELRKVMVHVVLSHTYIRTHDLGLFHRWATQFSNEC